MDVAGIGIAATRRVEKDEELVLMIHTTAEAIRRTLEKARYSSLRGDGVRLKEDQT